jgi:XTP/dITP diphosphohydrolase
MLILGTANRKKGRELADLFAAVGVEVKTLADFPGTTPVEEHGATFAENAALKAAGYAQQLHHWVLADDSGLTVDILDGAPGVHSARYAAEDTTANSSDLSNNALLLEKLKNVPLEKRGAQFVCHIALAGPDGTIRAESEAACRGRILFEPRGQEGFGYDPLFEIVEYHHSFAELGHLVKECLSHRARAARMILPKVAELAEMIKGGEKNH